MSQKIVLNIEADFFDLHKQLAHKGFDATAIYTVVETYALATPVELSLLSDSKDCEGQVYKRIYSSAQIGVPKDRLFFRKFFCVEPCLVHTLGQRQPASSEEFYALTTSEDALVVSLYMTFKASRGDDKFQFSLETGGQRRVLAEAVGDKRALDLLNTIAPTRVLPYTSLAAVRANELAGCDKTVGGRVINL